MTDLDVMGSPPWLGSYDGGDTETQQVTNSLGRQEGIRWRNLLKVRREPRAVEDAVVVDLIHGVPEGGLLTDIAPVLGPIRGVEQTTWILLENEDRGVGGLSEI